MHVLHILQHIFTLPPCWERWVEGIVRSTGRTGRGPWVLLWQLQLLNLTTLCTRPPPSLYPRGVETSGSCVHTLQRPGHTHCKHCYTQIHWQGFEMNFRRKKSDSKNILLQKWFYSPYSFQVVDGSKWLNQHYSSPLYHLFCAKVLRRRKKKTT